MPDLPPLRPAVADDAAPLAQLIRLAFAAQSVATDPPSSALQEDQASLAAHFAGGAGGVLAEGPIAALLWAEQDGGLYVGRLAVHPEWRGRGLARRLLAAAEQVARSRGLTRLHLSTRLVLQDNRRLFLACGFREIGFTTHHGYAAPTSVTMEKQLTP